MGREKRKASFLRRVQWRIEFIAYIAAEWVMRRVPMSWCTTFGRAAGHLVWAVTPGRRRAVRDNMRIAFRDQMDEASRHRLAKASVVRSIENLMASIKTTVMPPEEVKQRVRIIGLEHYQAAKAQGKGVIALLAHTGNWEVMAQIGPLADPEGKIGTYFRPLNNPLTDAWVRRRRARMGTTLFPKAGDFREPAAFIREQGVFGILCDQRVGRHGHVVSYFGRMSSFVYFPLILQRRTRAPIISASVETESPGRWILRFGPAFDHQPTPNAADLAARIEEMIRQSPVDYFWMQERWPAPRRHPLEIEGKGDLVQPAQSEARVIYPIEVLVVGDMALPELAHLQYHRIGVKHTEEVKKALERLNQERPAGIDWIFGPRSLLEPLAKDWPCYDENGRRISLKKRK